MNKKKLIPELRFPEFVGEREWEEKKLGELANKIVEKNKDGLINNVFTNSAIDGIIDQREYFDKDIANKNNLVNYYIVDDGDYVYNPRISNIAPVGPISKNKTAKKGVLSPLYTVFRFKSKNNNFYEYYFKTIHWYTAIKKASNTGARFDRMSITDSVFMSIPVLYPSSKEQQKIASCLFSLDEVIISHSQKLELLKDHKKGLMQNLFPQKGEKVPKYRFKEFVKGGDWELKKLGDLGNFLGGGTPNRSNSSYWIGNIPWISSSDIKDDDIHNISTTRFINNNSIKESTTKIIPKGSVLFISRVGVGKLAINKEELCTSQDFTSFVPKKGILNFFIGYYFSSNKNLLQSLNQGTSIKGFSKNDLENIKLPYPKNTEEQQKIASCLSSLDELITAQTAKIEQLKLHKKGLMQGLFPSNK